MHEGEAGAGPGALPPLVAAMMAPGFYRHRPARVELRQTHISYVLLAGAYVYKIKKPVRFAFLDYGTLERRRHFCEEEVRLNRRLAPDVYLGVVPLIERAGSFELGEGAVATPGWTTVEYAVRMRRLPDDRMLDRLLKAGRVREEDLRAVARRLASFHSAASTEDAPLFGAPDAVARTLEENFEETEPLVGRTISEPDFAAIRRYSTRFLAENREVFKVRIREGRVREGHGDLRAEHVCLIDGVVVFDCVEFSKRLRYCDVSSELAFLAMDLDFLGAPVLARDLIRAYAGATGDETLTALLPFYQCYRAYVRGKVESLKSMEAEVPGGERERAGSAARR